MAMGEGRFTVPRVQIIPMDALVVEQKPLPEDHPFYALIGRVVAEWARFEHILDQIIWDLADGENDILSSITGQIMNYNARIKIIRALARYRGFDESIITEVNKLTKCIFGLAEERNRYVHDAWFIQEAGVFVSEPGQFKSITGSNKKFGFNPIKKEDTLQLIKNIQERAKVASNVRSLLSQKPQP